MLTWQIFSQVVLKKKIFEYLISISMVQAHDPLEQGRFRPGGGLLLNRLGKKPLPVSSSSREQDF